MWCSLCRVTIETVIISIERLWILINGVLKYHGTLFSLSWICALVHLNFALIVFYLLIGIINHIHPVSGRFIIMFNCVSVLINRTPCIQILNRYFHLLICLKCPFRFGFRIFFRLIWKFCIFITWSTASFISHFLFVIIQILNYKIK